jgi:hypothetical protein
MFAFIPATFLLFLNSRIHSSLKSKTPLICVSGLVHLWNETSFARGRFVFLTWGSLQPNVSPTRLATCSSICSFVASSPSSFYVHFCAPIVKYLLAIIRVYTTLPLRASLLLPSHHDVAACSRNSGVKGFLNCARVTMFYLAFLFAFVIDGPWLCVSVICEVNTAATCGSNAIPTTT